MTKKDKEKKNLRFDVIVVGAGPAGMAFACGLAQANLKIAVIDKQSKKIISNPKIDGREIALTHNSVKVLKELKIWKFISNKLVSPIKEARVLDGDFKYFLNFEHDEIKKESLGYLVPNYIIKKNLYKKLKLLNNVKLMDKAECISINIGNKFANIKLSNGKILQSSLVVAADSRFSKIRSQMGISAFTRNFNKNMIVCRMKHEKSHKNISYEFFRYNQTQALLPYIKNQSGIVTTADKKYSSVLMKMNKKQFNKEIENDFNNFFGKMNLVGKRYCYPMITTYTKKFISHRFALIGDAAVGMHPVTAHGFNLSLQGIEILNKELKDALNNNKDIGSVSILSKYQSAFHRIAAPIYLTTNTIVNLYTSNILPAKITRQFMLRFVNTVKPVKETFLNILK